jgi:hypothetical protein
LQEFFYKKIEAFHLFSEFIKYKTFFKENIMKYNALIFSLMLILSGCFPFPDRNRNSYGDITPPVFTGLSAESPTTVTFNFDEAVTPKPELFRLSDNLQLSSVTFAGSTVTVTTNASMLPGRRYNAEVHVTDNRANHSAIITSFYGYNDKVPDIVINEIRVNGSKSRPDAVELLVKSPGNTAGLTIYRGSSGFNESGLTLPPIKVAKGDYFVIHFRPEGLEQEIDEVSDKTVSGGRESGDSHYDFWVKDGAGLSGTNGTVSLYTNPSGSLIDTIVYSNRNWKEDERYGSFGTSRAYNCITEIFEQGGWQSETPGLIKPEDCVSPDGSTSTRTICRSNGEDTDSLRDWHIVPSSSCTMGTVNCEEVYQPN